MRALLGSEINFIEGTVVRVYHSTCEPEDEVTHLVTDARTDGQAIWFEIGCDPRAWRREHRAGVVDDGTAPTCLGCVGARP